MLGKEYQRISFHWCSSTFNPIVKLLLAWNYAILSSLFFSMNILTALQ